MFTVSSTLMWAVLTGQTDWVCHTGTLNAVCRGGCLELYYCNMVEWFRWDSSLIYEDQLVSFSALTLLVWSSGLKKSSPNDLLCVEWDVKPYTLTHSGDGRTRMDTGMNKQWRGTGEEKEGNEGQGRENVGPSKLTFRIRPCFDFHKYFWGNDTNTRRLAILRLVSAWVLAYHFNS